MNHIKIVIFLLFVTTKVTANNEMTALETMTIYSNGISQDIKAPDLNSTLRNKAGIIITQGVGQMASNISLRGAGGQGILTLDNVPLFSDFVGVYSLNHYSLDALDAAKITHGFNNDLYASKTLGGSVQLQTRQMEKNDTFLRVEGGSYDTLREIVGGGIDTEFGNFSGVLGHHNIFDAPSEAKYGQESDNSEMNHISGNWKKNFSSGNIGSSFYFVRTNKEIDGPGLLPNHSFGWVDDKLGHLLDETSVMQLSGSYNLANNWDTALQLGFTQNQQTMKTTLIKPFSITNQMFMIDWKNNHFFTSQDNIHNSISLSWGVNTQYQQTLNKVSSFNTISPNLQAAWKKNQWLWSINTRVDQSEIYGKNPIFSLGIKYFFDKNILVFANGGNGYRQPGVSELMHPIYGNKTLMGESSLGGELGTQWYPSVDSEINVTGYYQKYKNMITMQFNPKIGTVRAENLNEATVFGSEIQFQHRWTKMLKSGINYGYMRAKNSTTQLDISMLPNNQGSIWSEIQLFSPVTLLLDLNLHDNYWFDGSNKIKANSATHLNTLLTYQFTKKMSMYVRGENITNNRTAEINNFNFNGAAVYFGFKIGY